MAAEGAEGHARCMARATRLAMAMEDTLDEAERRRRNAAKVTDARFTRLPPG